MPVASARAVNPATAARAGFLARLFGIGLTEHDRACRNLNRSKDPGEIIAARNFLARFQDPSTKALLCDHGNRIKWAENELFIRETVAAAPHILIANLQRVLNEIVCQTPEAQPQIDPKKTLARIAGKVQDATLSLLLQENVSLAKPYFSEVDIEKIIGCLPADKFAGLFGRVSPEKRSVLFARESVFVKISSLLSRNNKAILSAPEFIAFCIEHDRSEERAKQMIECLPGKKIGKIFSFIAVYNRHRLLANKTVFEKVGLLLSQGDEELISSPELAKFCIIYDKSDGAKKSYNIYMANLLKAREFKKFIAVLMKGPLTELILMDLSDSRLSELWEKNPKSFAEAAIRYPKEMESIIIRIGARLINEQDFNKYRKLYAEVISNINDDFYRNPIKSRIILDSSANPIFIMEINKEEDEIKMNGGRKEPSGEETKVEAKIDDEWESAKTMHDIPIEAVLGRIEKYYGFDLFWNYTMARKHHDFLASLLHQDRNGLYKFKGPDNRNLSSLEAMQELNLCWDKGGKKHFEARR